MKVRKGVLFGVLLFSVVFALSACSPPEPPAPASPLAAYQGHWVVLNYWAEWCKPCREEIPELNELHHSRDDVEVLGVNYDGVAGAALADLADEMGVEFIVVEQDPASQMGFDRPDVLPTTMVFAPDGSIRARLVGPQTRASLEAIIDERV